MSKLRKEIQSLLTGAEIAFPRSFTGFQGHFPGRPILPGVCKILTVQVLLEVALGQAVRLRRIVLAKFIAPVGADETVAITLKHEDAGDGVRSVRAQFSAPGKRIAEIHLEVQDA